MIGPTYFDYFKHEIVPSSMTSTLMLARLHRYSMFRNEWLKDDELKFYFNFKFKPWDVLGAGSLGIRVKSPLRAPAIRRSQKMPLDNRVITGRHCITFSGKPASRRAHTLTWFCLSE